MMVCRGKVQKASGVTHLIAEHLIDQTDLLNSVGGCNEAFIGRAIFRLLLRERSDGSQ
jgi:error-prone DNA polymerase